uniref:Hydrolases of the alpha/beta superfamily n=1 Tax=Rheinheimera sp. BAL341 TaxID=1708203 RepID=A0A486XJT6_9GAMM
MSEINPFFTINATDGYPLVAQYYQAKSAKGIIIVASATGVPQGFYRHFAKFASEQGFDVVTFDYRGIGRSAPESLKGFDVDFRDWARKDLQAVVDKMRSKALPLFLLGHSYGGHALGLIDNHQYLNAAYFFGVGAGWHGWMPRLEQIKVTIMWHLVAPVITRIKGFLGWSKLGMGENLPLGVYKQWKRWCGFPHYFFDDDMYPEMKNLFATVKTPFKAVNAIDDKWAMPRSRDAFIKHYQFSDSVTEDINPKNLGLNRIGHMGYFRRQSQVIWPDIVSYFERYR